jgi:hypothetical protein
LSNKNISISFLVISILVSNIAFAQWKQDSFIFGAYSEPKLSKRSLERASECYINLFTRVGGNMQPESTIYQYLRFLDSSNAGIRTLIADRRYYISDKYVPFSDSDAHSMSEVYSENKLGHLRKSVFYGYYLRDEPGADSLTHTTINKWNSFIQSKDSEKLTYINLLPRYGFSSDSAYEAYVRSYLFKHKNGSSLKVLSVDYYPFLTEGRKRKDYFYNLAFFRDIAGDSIPIWVYVLTASSNKTYDPPNESQLRYMNFVPLTYGVKGLLYYIYANPGEGYRGGLVSWKTGEPTDSLYYMTKRINKYIKNVVAPIIMEQHYIGTFHVALPNDENSKYSKLLSKNSTIISSISDPEIFVGIFQSLTKPDVEYSILLTNKSLERKDSVLMTIKGKPIVTVTYMDNTQTEEKNIVVKKLIGMYSGENSNFLIPSVLGGQGIVLNITYN